MNPLLIENQLTLVSDHYSSITDNLILSNVKSKYLYGVNMRPTVDVVSNDKDGFVFRQISATINTALRSRKVVVSYEHLQLVGFGQTDPRKAGRYVYFANGGFVLFTTNIDHMAAAQLLGPDFSYRDIIGAGSIQINPDQLTLSGWGSFKRYESGEDKTHRIGPCEDFTDYNAIAHHFGIPAIASTDNVASLTARRQEA